MHWYRNRRERAGGAAASQRLGSLVRIDKLPEIRDHDHAATVGGNGGRAMIEPIPAARGADRERRNPGRLSR
jgi:hypothetical protein